MIPINSSGNNSYCLSIFYPYYSIILYALLIPRPPPNIFDAFITNAQPFLIFPFSNYVNVSLIASIKFYALRVLNPSIYIISSTFKFNIWGIELKLLL